MAAFRLRIKNNKWTSGILAIAAIVVWTGVVLRITEPARPRKPQRELPKASSKNVKDSAVFTLRLDYEDPFHLFSTPKPTASPARQSTNPAKVNVRPSAEVQNMLYLGSVANALGRRKALIKYRDKYYYAEANDTIGAFKVRRVYTDSITLTSAGKRIVTTIKRKPVNVH